MSRGKDVLFGYKTTCTFMYPLCVTIFRPFSKGNYPWLLFNASSFVNLTVYEFLSSIDRIATPWLLIDIRNKNNYTLKNIVYSSNGSNFERHALTSRRDRAARAFTVLQRTSVSFIFIQTHSPIFGSIRIFLYVVSLFVDLCWAPRFIPSHMTEVIRACMVCLII